MDGVYVVTGGGRGIGAATVLRLAAPRRTVCLTWTSRQDAAEDVAARCRASGADAVAVRADVAHEADVVALFDLASSLGPLRGVVNNAGVLARKAASSRSPPSGSCGSWPSTSWGPCCAAGRRSSGCRRASAATVARS